MQHSDPEAATAQESGKCQWHNDPPRSSVILFNFNPVDMVTKGCALCDYKALMSDMKINSLSLEQPWQALLDSAGEGIWGVDLHGDCTFVNRAALAMLGYRSEELIGRNMHQVVHHHHPDGSVYLPEDCIIYNVFKKSHLVTNHVDHLFRKDGSVLWTELSARPILTDGSDGQEVRGAVVTFRDITQARLAEAALRRSEKLAAVGQLASSIAHEINNPLEAVINLLYLVRTADSLEQVRTFAALAESELARVNDITIQTLRFHRQQSAAAPLDLAEMAQAVLRLYASRFTARKVETQLRMRFTPPALLFEGEVRQVLNNLVRNAYDAMPRGGVLHVRIRPAPCPSTGKPGVRMTVADTGTGFLSHMRAHLFEPFHSSKEATGTGLGLWISKGIIDKHGGRIRMRSRLETFGSIPGDTALAAIHGTVFAVWLPLQPEK